MCSCGEGASFRRNLASYRTYAAAALNAMLGSVELPVTRRATGFEQRLDFAIKRADRIAREMCRMERDWVEEGQGE
ncbi:MAG: hypothetical protein OXG58_11500 [Gemmatimonadetes bacterium]|nr:hypothetical protein [Gemmatimonadota bacterium]MCY3943479.1 hypothetical protein [Gemmatimonadota bacterium]